MTTPEHQEAIARRRFGVLQLAGTLGNVSAACRQAGMTRTQFYEYKRRYEQQGMEGLKDFPPIHQTHPQTTPTRIAEQVIAFSLEHPAWGCVRLSDHLKLQGIAISSPTVQRLLITHDLAKAQDRLFVLEAQANAGTRALTPEQVDQIERANPCYRERYAEWSRPGELLCQGTFVIGQFTGVGKVYLHAVVDSYSSYAFGVVHYTAAPEVAVALLHRAVLPFYTQRAIGVAAVLTADTRTFCGDASRHPYEGYLAQAELLHRVAPTIRRSGSSSPATSFNGFFDRFSRSVRGEFAARAARQATPYPSVAALRTDFERWLFTYNTQRPHGGYRNWGLPPLETMTMYVQQREAAA